jgi:hypothetical protein
LCLACLACPEELALPALPFALEGTPALLGPLAAILEGVRQTACMLVLCGTTLWETMYGPRAGGTQGIRGMNVQLYSLVFSGPKTEVDT